MEAGNHHSEVLEVNSVPRRVEKDWDGIYRLKSSASSSFIATGLAPLKPRTIG